MNLLIILVIFIVINIIYLDWLEISQIRQVVELIGDDSHATEVTMGQMIYDGDIPKQNWGPLYKSTFQYFVVLT